VNYKNILVIGGSGFVGRHLVAALSARGTAVTVPCRRREHGKHLILLPTVDVVTANVYDPRVLSGLMKGCDAVVNLVGILHGRHGRPDERGPNNYGPDFARAHVELPQAVVTACREAGVRRVLHMSALCAEPSAPSEYLRSKGIGEGVMLAAEDLHTTIFRPSVVFGPDDRFLNLFATLAGISPALILPCPEARFQPVYVGDVVRAFLGALEDREPSGARHDLCGPKVYTMRELAQYVCSVTGRRRLIIGMPEWLAKLEARLWELTPAPLMSRDNLASMSVPSISDTLMPYGIVPVAMEAVAPSWLVPSGPRERYPELRFRARR
jgi:NADH dehydrogenase